MCPAASFQDSSTCSRRWCLCWRCSFCDRRAISCCGASLFVVGMFQILYPPIVLPALLPIWFLELSFFFSEWADFFYGVSHLVLVVSHPHHSRMSRVSILLPCHCVLGLGAILSVFLGVGGVPGYHIVILLHFLLVSASFISSRRCSRSALPVLGVVDSGSCWHARCVHVPFFVLFLRFAFIAK